MLNPLFPLYKEPATSGAQGSNRIAKVHCAYRTIEEENLGLRNREKEVCVADEVSSLAGVT